VKQVILTRNTDDGQKTAMILRARGFDPILAPLFATVPIPHSVPDIAFAAVIATSRHALHLLSATAQPTLKTLPLYCVGAATAESAHTLGFKTILTGPGTAAGLAAEILQTRKKGEALLFLTGDPHRPELEQALAPHFALTTLSLYRSKTCADFPAEALRKITDPDPIWLHFSLNSAERAAVLIEKAGQAALFYQGQHIALSPPISDHLTRAGCKTCLTAAEPNLEAMLDALNSLRNPKTDPELEE
jgi:uroporphyrinogen-III synthase